MGAGKACFVHYTCRDKIIQMLKPLKWSVLKLKLNIFRSTKTQNEKASWQNPNKAVSYSSHLKWGGLHPHSCHRGQTLSEGDSDHNGLTINSSQPVFRSASDKLCQLNLIERN